MKISNETLNILKNFSSINSGIFVNVGNTLSTMSLSKTILAKSKIKETFPQSFGIYDLNNLLALLSIEKDNTELEFDEHHVILSNLGGRSKINYRFTDKSMIVVPPDKEINIGTPDVIVSINVDDLRWINKISNLLQSPHIAFEGDGTTLNIVCFDLKNDSAHKNSLTIGETKMKFRFVFKVENINKILDDSYVVEISQRGITHWTNEANTIQYWITTEKDGNFYN